LDLTSPSETQRKALFECLKFYLDYPDRDGYLRVMELLISQYGEYPATAAGLVEILRNINEPWIGLQMAEPSLALGPLEPEIYFLVGEFYYENGEQEEAIRLLSKYQEECNSTCDESGTLLLLALSHLDLENRDEFIRLLEELISEHSLSREAPKAWLLLAQDAIRMGDKGRAKELLETIMSEYPNKPEVRTASGLFSRMSDLILLSHAERDEE